MALMKISHAKGYRGLWIVGLYLNGCDLITGDKGIAGQRLQCWRGGQPWATADISPVSVVPTIPAITRSTDYTGTYYVILRIQ